MRFEDLKNGDQLICRVNPATVANISGDRSYLKDMNPLHRIFATKCAIGGGSEFTTIHTYKVLKSDFTQVTGIEPKTNSEYLYFSCVHFIVTSVNGVNVNIDLNRELHWE